MEDCVEDLSARVRHLKECDPLCIPVGESNVSIGRLRVVTWEDARDWNAVGRLARWHDVAFSWFPEPFSVTTDGARRWLVDRVLSDPSRLLFWVHTVSGEVVGHLGLSALNARQGTATIGDVIPAHPRFHALLSAAVETLTHWAQSELGVKPTPAPQVQALAA